jgi:hypothetical protein
MHCTNVYDKSIHINTNITSISSIKYIHQEYYKISDVNKTRIKQDFKNNKRTNGIINDILDIHVLKITLSFYQ